jgi:hypothetical protein
MAQQMSVLGIDIAKQVFHVVGMDDSGADLYGECTTAPHRDGSLWECP